MRVRDIELGKSRAVVKSNRYEFQFMKGKEYIITGYSRVLNVTEDGELAPVEMLLLEPEVGGRSGMWMMEKDITIDNVQCTMYNVQ